MASPFSPKQIERLSSSISTSIFYTKSSCDAYVNPAWEAQCDKVQSNLQRWLLICGIISGVGLILTITGLIIFNNPTIDDQTVFLIFGSGILLLLGGIGLYFIQNGRSLKSRSILGKELLRELAIPKKI